MAESTQLQQALALRKQNPNLTTRDAVAQVRQTTAPAINALPVQPTWGATIPIAKEQTMAPVAPTPAPAPIGQAGDTVTGVNGEKFVQANNPDMTTAPQITEQQKNTQLWGFIQDNGINSVQPLPKWPTQLSTWTKELVKAKEIPTVDYTQATGRENEIKTNVEWFIKSWMTPYKVKQASGYDIASPEKKAIIDGILGGQPSQDQIFTSLKQGVTVWDPKSVEYRQAQARISTFKKYSTYDTSSIATSLASGDLLVGTRSYNDLVSDPNMALKIQKAMAFNKGEVDLVKVGETQMANVLAQNPTVATALADNFISKDEYDQLTNNQEVSAQLQKVEVDKTKYETIKAQYDNVETDVDSEFQWKEVTDSFKAKIVADRRKGMYKDYQIASLEYQNSLGTYTNLKADATALLGQNMELYKEQKLQEAELAKEQRQQQYGRENAVFQADLWLKKQQAEFEQGLAQQAERAKDPTTAIWGILAQFQKLGITPDMDVAGHLASFQSSWLSLPEYTKKMIENFKAKPEYKAMMDAEMRKLAPPVVWMTQDWTRLTDNTLYNQKTGETKTVSGQNTTIPPSGSMQKVTLGNKTVTLDSVASSSITSAFDEIKATGQNLIVGEWHRDQVATIKSMAERYWIPFNSSNPAETARQLTNAGHTVAIPWYSKHETWMAIDLYSDGMKAPTPEQVKILNAKGWFQTAGANDMGHFEYLGAQWSQWTGTQWASTDAQNWFNLIQKGTTNYEDVMKKLWGTKVWQSVLQEINSLISSKWGAIPALPDSDQVKKMDDLISKLESIGESQLENISGGLQFSPWDSYIWKKKSTALGNINYVLKWNTLQQLIDAKAQGATFGALSNEELKMLQDSASALSAYAEVDEKGKITWFDVDQDTFKAEIKAITDLYKAKKAKMLNPWIQAQQEDTNSGTWDTLWIR